MPSGVIFKEYMLHIILMRQSRDCRNSDLEAVVEPAGIPTATATMCHDVRTPRTL